MGAIRLPLRPARPSSGGRLTEAAAFAAVAVAALLIATRLGEHSPLAMVAVAGGMLLVGWMAYSTRYELTLGVLAAYLLLADGYLKLHFGGQLPVIGRDALLYAIAGGALLRFLVMDRSLSLPPLAGWVLGWAVIVLAEVANPHNGTLGHTLQALRPHLEFVPLFFLGYAAMRTPGRLRGFLWILLACAALNGYASFVQSNLTPDQLAAWGPGYAQKIYGEDISSGGVSGRSYVDASGNERNRPFALGSDIGFGGSLGVLAAPAALALLAVSRRRSLLVLLLPLAAGTALAVATSQARISVLGAIAAVGVYAAIGSAARRRFATLATIALGVIVTWLVVTSLVGSTYSGIFDRYQSIAPDRVLTTAYDYRKDTLGIIPSYITSFPLGAGLGTVGPGASTGGGNGRILNGESEFTLLLIETGVAGLLVMLGLHLRLLHLLLTRIRRVVDPDTRLMLAAIGAPLLSMFLAWSGGPTTANMPNSPFLFFAAGVLAWWLADRRAAATS